VDEERLNAGFAILAFQDSENRISLAVGLALVDGDSGRFVDDQQASVFR
jgi:hypothetical protein